MKKRTQRWISVLMLAALMLSTAAPIYAQATSNQATVSGPVEMQESTTPQEPEQAASSTSEAPAESAPAAEPPAAEPSATAEPPVSEPEESAPPAGEAPPATVLGSITELVKAVRADDTLAGYGAENVLDGDPSTIWHTNYEEGSTDFPHELEFTFHAPQQIESLTYAPRANHGAPHFIKSYQLFFAESETAAYAEAPNVSGELTVEERTISFDAVTAQKVKLVMTDRSMPNNEEDQISMSVGDVSFGLSSTTPPVDPPEQAVETLPQSQLGATASSMGSSDYAAEKAIDGNNNTLWHGQWEGSNIPTHTITLQLDRAGDTRYAIKSVVLTSRSDVNSAHESINGVRCKISVSENGTDFTVVEEAASLKDGKGAVSTLPVNGFGRYVRLEAVDSHFMSAAELNVEVYTDAEAAVGLFALADEIRTAEVQLQEAKEQMGSDYDQYPAAAVAAFEKAIATAKAAMEAMKEIPAALAALKDAEKTLENSKKVFHASDFTALIEEAKALRDSVQVGTEDGNCSEEAKKTFEAAIAESETIDVETASSNELREAFRTLQFAMAAFRAEIIVVSGDATLDISGKWNFQMTDKESADQLTETVNLPGSMDENKKGNDNTANITKHHLNRDYVYVGPATYQRDITVPQDWDGKHVVLYLERTKKTRVWVDDTIVGPQQKSYTTAHEYDITEFLKPGQTQTLTVEVNNSGEGMPNAMYDTFLDGEAWSHQVSEFTQTNWNGIIGKMELRATPKVFITNFQIRPNVEKNTAKVTLELARTESEKAAEGTVLLRAQSWNNDKQSHAAQPQEVAFAFAAGETTATAMLNYEMGEGVLLWDEFSPTMYEMTAVLRGETEAGLVCSVQKTDFGMRAFTTGSVEGGKQFFINGRPTMLRGEINCAAFPETGHCPMDLASWMKIMQTYRDYGMNHVRFHTWVPPEAAFRAADILGIYLNFELPHWGRNMFGNVQQGDYTDVNYYKEDTLKIFNSYLNSPSAVMFALGNEERSGFYYYEEFLKFCTPLEPDLLYSDIAGHSSYPASADFAAKYMNPAYLPKIVENNNWDYASGVRSAPIAVLGHEPGQLQVYPNYEEEIPKYENAVVKPRNLEYFQNILKSAGIVDMADEFSQSTGRLAAMFYRYFTESYLRTNGAAGFHLLGLQDFPGQGTALVGILDAFLDSKGDITPEQFRQSCSELVVMTRMNQFVWTNDQTFSTDVVISNYTAGDLLSPIAWSLETLEGEVLQSGTVEAKLATQGKATTVGNITASLSGVDTAQRLKLKLKLTGSYTAPYAVGTNDYDIWVYPQEIDTSAPEDVSVYSTFNAKAQRDLAEGKKVLILSEGTREALPKSRAISFRPDFWSPMFHRDSADGYSLGMYIDESSPLFANYPTQDFAAWQWYQTVQGGRGILINGAPDNLKPLVQPIATIDLADRMAAVFEANVLEGKLMVCSLNLKNKTDPASKQLLASIYDYMESDSFAPEAELEPDYLRTLLPSQDMKGITAEVKSSIALEETAQITVKAVDYKGQNIALPEDATLRYLCENPKVATVDENGLLTGVGAGITRVKVTLDSDGITYESEAVVTVGQSALTGVSLEGAVVTVTSEDAAFPAKNLTDGNLNSFWHSDYTNTAEKMPQEVFIELPELTEVSSVQCSARRDNVGGAVLEASVAVSLDGENYTVVDSRTFPQDKNDRLFGFAQQKVKYIRISVERAVMDEDLTNAAAIAELALFNGKEILSVEKLPVHEVRYGTAREKVLAQYPLPEQVQVTLNDGTTQQLAPVWLMGDYNAGQPGDYTIWGSIFLEGAANPTNARAAYTIRVLPKDTTTPPDKTQLDALIAAAQKLTAENYTEDSWKKMREVLGQAISFNALTGAIQHDVDVWVDTLQEALDALRLVRIPTQIGQGAPAVTATATDTTKFPYNIQILVEKCTDEELAEFVIPGHTPVLALETKVTGNGISGNALKELVKVSVELPQALAELAKADDLTLFYVNGELQNDMGAAFLQKSKAAEGSYFAEFLTTQFGSFVFAKSTVAPTPTPTPTPTATPTATPAPTAEPSPAPTAEPSPAPTAEPSPTPTAAPSPAPTAEPSPAPTAEPTPTPVPVQPDQGNPTPPNPAPTAKPQVGTGTAANRWDTIAARIRNAEDGATIVIQMGKDSRIPARVLLAAAGREMTLTFQTSSGELRVPCKSWTESQFTEKSYSFEELGVLFEVKEEPVDNSGLSPEKGDVAVEAPDESTDEAVDAPAESQDSAEKGSFVLPLLLVLALCAGLGIWLVLRKNRKNQ